MNEMVERVAKALARCAGGRIVGPGQSAATREFAWEADGGHISHYVERHWHEYVGAATFAIEAMREPTAAMTWAGSQESSYDDLQLGTDHMADIWRAMIDAALK